MAEEVLGCVAVLKDQGESGDLLNRLRRRDPSALGDLAERYGKALARAAYLFLGDAHLAEDATHDALIGAWDGAKRTRETTPLRSWLFGILFNRCRILARSRSRRRRQEARFSSPRPRQSDGPETRLIRQEQSDILRESLAGLDEPLRIVVILRYERGFGVAETAQALGIPEGTVKSRTHEALKRLRETLGEDAG